jgi:hypothetical protein
MSRNNNHRQRGEREEGEREELDTRSHWPQAIHVMTQPREGIQGNADDQEDNNVWEGATLEEIDTIQADQVCITVGERRQHMTQQDKLRDQQRACQWWNKHPTQVRVQ